jgi:hypothetical protein
MGARRRNMNLAVSRVDARLDGKIYQELAQSREREMNNKRRVNLLIFHFDSHLFGGCVRTETETHQLIPKTALTAAVNLIKHIVRASILPPRLVGCICI